MKHVIIPSIKQSPPPPPPPPQQATVLEGVETRSSYAPNRPKFAASPPPPNMALLRSISNHQSRKNPLLGRNRRGRKPTRPTTDDCWTTLCSREYSGDISKLGSAERFLKAVLDIPFAFKRVAAMLYRANFDTEVKYLKKSFQTLELASEELKNRRMFFKLLEAVLRTGNRMNVGTNRGDAKAFELDTLLKLVDVNGTDGKTTLLHFVVQEITRAEGACTESTKKNIQESALQKFKENDFRKQGLQVVSGLSKDLSNVKKAAGMDSDVLNSYVSKLEMGLEKVRLVLQYERPDMQGKFFESLNLFIREADQEISSIKDDERKALSFVKEVAEYFHGDTSKDRTMVGSARSFLIATTASLPVLNRYNVRQDRSSDEDSSSP